MKKYTVLVLLLFAIGIKAQDSTVTKNITHELGFNSVLLLKQLTSNNANSTSSTLPQLPYQLIYTLNIKNKYGARLGLGFDQLKTETSITGQVKPRTTNVSTLSGRLGVNANVFTYRNFTFNAFADGLYEKSKSRTVTSTTVNSGPFGQVTEQTTDTQEETSGGGGEVGFGIKYNINKHFALYVETPVQFKILNSASGETFSTGGVVSSYTSTSSSITSTKIILPTTLFLNIIF